MTTIVVFLIRPDDTAMFVRLMRITKVQKLQIGLIAIATAMLLAQQAFAQSFSSGSDFNAVPISGQVTMTCNEGGVSKTVSFQCRDMSLSPVEYDFFVGPIMDASQVTLTVSRADGTVRVKTLDYDGRAGRSTQRFNLWVSALFQTPLLAEGANTIDYRLTKGSQAVSSGQFVTRIGRGAPLTCATANINSSTMSDCENMYSTCQRYFTQYNYCR